MSGRRKIDVTVPEGTPDQSTGLGTGMQLHANYSLQSIMPSDTNPRRQDLAMHGITLDTIRPLARAQNEDKDAFQTRVEQAIAEKRLSAKAHEAWNTLLGLAMSILEMGGVVQPVVLRVEAITDTTATLIAGERRFLASWMAGMTGVNAIVKISGSPSIEDALTENTQREDLSLSAMIATLRVIQSEREKRLSTRDVQRLSGYSRGAADEIRKVLELEGDHPVFEALYNGELTRPYHLQRFFNAAAGKGQGGASPQSEPAGRAPADSTGQATGAESGEEQRPNLDSSGQAQAHGAQPGTESQPGPANPKGVNWVAIKHFLHESIQRMDDVDDTEAFRPIIDQIHDHQSLAHCLDTIADRVLVHNEGALNE